MTLSKLSTNVQNVQALNDLPNANTGLTADQVKLAFDQAGMDIKEYLNTTLTVEADIALTLRDSNLTTHKSSGDHDGRYYTETEIDAQIALLETKADLTTARKLSATGDFTGTLNGYTIVAADPGLSSAFTALKADVLKIALNVKRMPNPYVSAVGDGITDDTAAINAALSYVTDFKRYVYLPDGDYLINPVTKLSLSSNTCLEFSKGARLICGTPAATTYSMLDVVSVSNIEIINPTIVGSRTTTQPVVEGAGHGISCRTVTNLKITGAKVSNCYTDGIYINDVTNGLIEFSNSDNNRRQGMSITNCNNLKVRDSSFGNSNGTAPQMGIDIEPNNATDQLKSLVFENVYTYSNTNSGIGINYNALNDATAVIDITFRNCRDLGSITAYSITKYAGTISEASTIKFIDCRSVDAGSVGMTVIGHKADGTAKISFIRPVIHNPNVNAGTNERSQNVAFSIHAETTGYPAGTAMGNVEIVHPSISMASGRTVLNGIFVGYNDLYKKIHIRDPIKIDVGDMTLLSANSNHNLIRLFADPTSDVVVTDAFHLLTCTSASTAIRNFSGGIYSEYISTTTVGTTTIYEFAKWNVIDYLRVIKQGAGGTLSVTLPATVTFIFAGAVVTGSLASTDTGAVITFQKIKNNCYKILKEFGTWA